MPPIPSKKAAHPANNGKPPKWSLGERPKRFRKARPPCGKQGEGRLPQQGDQQPHGDSPVDEGYLHPRLNGRSPKSDREKHDTRLLPNGQRPGYRQGHPKQPYPKTKREPRRPPRVEEPITKRRKGKPKQEADTRRHDAAEYPEPPSRKQPAKIGIASVPFLPFDKGRDGCPASR